MEPLVMAFIFCTFYCKKYNKSLIGKNYVAGVSLVRQQDNKIWAFNLNFVLK